MAQIREYRRDNRKSAQRTLRKEQERQRAPERGMTNLGYQTVEDTIFKAQREDLEQELDLEADLDPNEVYARHSIPDGDEEDDEAYEPGEEIHESDDWDQSDRSSPTEDYWNRAEWEGGLEGSGWMPRPDILVDCEETLTGPILHVRLAGRGLVDSRNPKVQSPMQQDRLTAFRARQRRLLEIAQYVSDYQKGFFLQRGPLKPLTQTHIADALWPQENRENKKSDVSRLMSGKWIRTPWGDVVPVEALFPGLLEYIKAILLEYDRVKVKEDGQVVVEKVIPVDSKRGLCIVSVLRQRLGNIDGLSPENVKHIMQEVRIPRVKNARIAAYKAGTAWWRNDL